MWPSVSITLPTLTPCYTMNTIHIACLIFHICDVRYPPEAPELQIRKMADLCFLVQHYELAYSCYHTAKKDFLSDQAMLYAAGALVSTHTSHTHTHCSVCTYVDHVLTALIPSTLHKRSLVSSSEAAFTPNLTLRPKPHSSHSFELLMSI